MTIRQRAAIPKSSDMVVSKDMYNGDKPHPSPPNFNTQQDEELTWKSLMPAIAVSILVSIAAYYACGNIEMMEDILVCCVRTIVQLTLLASLLSPLFKLVDGQQTKVKSTKYNTAPLLVLGYVFFFMLPLAAWEASSRSKLTLHPMGINNSLLFNNNIVLVIVMVSLLTAVSLMGAIALFVIVKPKPWYSPRHVIPLCGMLFNNALSAISVCLDILFSELQSKQRDTIELMISFGSDPWSATRPILRSVLSSSMKPQVCTHIFV
jgi:ABC-type iron transport system FetAB permease component